MSLHGLLYRIAMRISHRFNWHYAPPIYPENDVQLWCRWCGFRMTLPRTDTPGMIRSGKEGDRG